MTSKSFHECAITVITTSYKKIDYAISCLIKNLEFYDTTINKTEIQRLKTLREKGNLILTANFFPDAESIQFNYLIKIADILKYLDNRIFKELLDWHKAILKGKQFEDIKPNFSTNLKEYHEAIRATNLQNIFKLALFHKTIAFELETGSYDVLDQAAAVFGTIGDIETALRLSRGYRGPSKENFIYKCKLCIRFIQYGFFKKSIKIFNTFKDNEKKSVFKFFFRYFLRKNTELAIRFAKLVADQGLGFAQYYLSCQYNLGKFTEKNEENFLKYCQLAAKQNHVFAQKDLDFYLKYKKELFNKEEEAFKNCKISADQGDKDAQYKLALYYEFDPKNLNIQKEAFKYCKLSADLGHKDAQHRLALYYEIGFGTNMSLKNAYNFYKETGDINITYEFALSHEILNNRDLADKFYALSATDDSHPEALNHLARKNDYEMAFECYKLSAEQNNSDAYNAMGELIEFENHPETNPEVLEQAFNYYKLSSEMGNPDGQYNTGCFYEEIKEDKDHNIKAFEYYRLAAAQSHTRALKSLGDCYRKGIGCEQNNQLAISCYKQAANNFDSSSHHYLGWYYENGIGIEKNEVLAFEHYQEASFLRHFRSCYDLGRCYEFGIGVEKDINKALTNYTKAKDMHDHAKEAMQRVKKRISDNQNN